MEERGCDKNTPGPTQNTAIEFLSSCLFWLLPRSSAVELQV